MKKTIYLIMLIILIGSAMGEICEEIQQPNAQCQMLTPYLTCDSYTYEIIDSYGEIKVSDTLSSLNDSIYYLNFNQSLGDYIVKLCDNSTREIYVQTEDKMDFLNGIVILPLLIGALLLIGAWSLGQEHTPIKIFMFLLALLTPILSFQYSISITNNQTPTFTEMLSELGTHAGIFGWAYAIIFIYFVLYVAITIMDYIRENKKKKLEY